MTEKTPGWLERVFLPRLGEIYGEIKALNARIDGLDSKIDAVDAKLTARIDAVGEKLSAKIDDLEKRLAIVQSLSVLEAKRGELQPKR